jgi:hypothetical protein
MKIPPPGKKTAATEMERHPLPNLSRISHGNDHRLPRERGAPFVFAAPGPRQQIPPKIYLFLDAASARIIQVDAKWTWILRAAGSIASGRVTQQSIDNGCARRRQSNCRKNRQVFADSAPASLARRAHRINKP